MIPRDLGGRIVPIQTRSNSMPAINEKRSVLNGRGVVFCYVTDPSKWYYRELIPGTKKYKTKLIPGATTIEEAVMSVIDVAFELQDKKVDTTKPAKTKKRVSITDAVNSYLHSIYEKFQAGLAAESTYEHKKVILIKHLIPYLLSVGVTYTDEINTDTFQQYPIYRRQAAKYTRKKELSTIKTFINEYLIRYELVSPSVAMSKTLIPKILMKQVEFDANPAISAEDFKVITEYVESVYLPAGAKHNSPRVHHWRYLMWTFILVAKNTGCRPNELLKLRWRDVEFQTMEEDRVIAYLTVTDSKTGMKREIPAHIGSMLLKWMQYRIKYIKQHQPDLYTNMIVNQLDQLVFGNPHNEFRSYNLVTYQHSWREIVSGCSHQLRGNKFSDRPYTIYSLRKTFIEQHLIAGLDIFLLARLCGHSVKVLETHYERMDIRKRSDEITRIGFEKKKNTLKISDVLASQSSSP